MTTGFSIEALGLGAVIGLSLGALGAGGSILTVPILVYFMGVPVQSATGTSLAVVGLNAAAGAVDYLRRGRSLPRTGIAFGLSGLLGALGGTSLNHQARPDLVLILFSALMVVAAWSLLRRRPVQQESSGFDEHYGAGDWLRLVAVGITVGLLTGFFGVGGGFLIVPALVVVLRLPMRLAVGTSLLAIALNALWGLLGYLRFGAIDWELTALFAAGGLLGVLVGGKLAGRLPERTLRTFFASVIVLIAIYSFMRSASALTTTT